MKDNDPFKTFEKVLQNSFLMLGFKDFVIRNMETKLQKAGFVNIHTVVKKIPISNWASDKYLRALGMFLKFAMVDALGGIAAKPLAAINMTEEERTNLVATIKKSMNDNTIHRYIRFGVWYAQKPGAIG
ncbi:hypothetical protein ESCO_000232 [Escovopsis weberi]|uniref:Uncharacterized protein n=1 Tax=Escovopsis weberi TaxID=150374 RepID=A0A0M8MYK2_ESCWE|nr:hypothetical protein ESCO_000232 [Escovopsis weberi]